MTQYLTVPVKKRNFTVPVKVKEIYGTAVSVVLSDDTYIARNGDTYIARNGDTYLARGGTTSAYPYVVRVEKRNFSVVVKVKNG